MISRPRIRMRQMRHPQHKSVICLRMPSVYLLTFCALAWSLPCGLVRLVWAKQRSSLSWTLRRRLCPGVGTVQCECKLQASGSHQLLPKTGLLSCPHGSNNKALCASLKTPDSLFWTSMTADFDVVADFFLLS